MELIALLIVGGLLLFGIWCIVNEKKEKPAFLATEYHPELEASYSEKAKGVTEPVLAFVRTIRQNPKRFKLKRIDRGFYTYGFDYWNFRDKENGKEWNFTTYQSFNSTVIIQGLPSWLTEEEKQYLHKEFKDIFKESRRKKLHQIQRERMKRLYK